MTTAVNPDKLLGSSEIYRSLHDAVEAAVDVIKREYDGYRAADIPGPADVVYGDPFEITKYPTFAVFPEDGELEEPAGGVFRGIDRIKVKVYWAKVEQAGVDNVFPQLVKTIDALTLMFTDFQTLAAADGTHRVSRIIPLERQIGVVVEETRADRKLFTRAAELTLQLRSFTWRANC